MALQCFPISDHVSFPREYGSLFQLYPYSRVFSCATVKQRNNTLGNDTWSEMGKHCNATEKVYLDAHTPSCKKVVIGRKNFCNLVRKEYIKRQKKRFSFSDFLLFF